ncbi:polysaccharide deacetylase family protein [Paenibacillus aurantius]|uniref:Polysaccharide deacetylase family protein n=1 Tax=Paenibacillus aurantius TaxID=2918900 RepID=A0AA96LDR0_9BACL|nr:polysaccharide deacetylase family protein [Paenibacillus aurantius]WNQ12144.1 polysaccharide deacetylase family protein [Paenibacillus aurantius]
MTECALIKKWIEKKRLILLLIGAVLLPAAGWPPSAAAAASADKGGDRASLQETYAQLKAGKRVGGPGEAAKPPEERTVYLTFDDGPSRLTPQVLDILKEQGVQATFFQLGQSAQAYPQYVRRVLAEGHAIGNHSYDHVYNKLYSDFASFWGQIRRTEDALYDIAGIRPRLVRAPGGTATNFDAFYYYYLDQAGYRVTDWNTDSQDASRAGVPADEIIRAVKNTPLKQEMNVLMHDGTGHEQTVKALPAIIAYFKEHGYRFAALSQEVKPVQFGIAKLKWTRSESFEGFQDHLASAWERAAAWKDEGSGEEAEAPAGKPEKQEPPEVRAEPEPPSPQAEPYPLKLKIGEEEITLDGTRYDLREGRLAVPLRLLAEKLGARVEWNGTEMSAAVTLGGQRLEYRLLEHTIREKLPDGSWKGSPLADFRLVNGEIRVGLRKTAELLGGRIGRVVFSAETREVEVRGPGFRLLPLTA